jgi:hypothetical protein
MRRSNASPFQFLHFVFRWLLPWATTLAISASIAHVAGAMLGPALPIETGTRVTSTAESATALVHTRPSSAMIPSIETSATMPVPCPAGPYTTTDVQVVSLQDLNLLMSSQCDVRP